MDFYCDHTGSVVIEKKGAISEDGKRQITYAGIDRKGNIGRAERTVTYTDHAETVFSLKAPLRFPMNQNFNLKRYIEAENDGYFDPMAYYEGSDLGTMPEIESDVNTNQPGVYHVTYTVGSRDAAGVSRLVVVVKE